MNGAAFTALLGRVPAALRWSLATFLAALLLHADRLPWWCTVAVIALAGWKIAIDTGRMRAPPALLRNGVALVVLLAVAASFGGISGLAAGTALLAIMGALKLLETDRARDHLIMFAVSLFLLVAACLDRQDLWRLPPYAAHLWLGCATLAAVATPDVQLTRAEAFRVSGRALLFSLPVAIAFFLLFPRVQGQLWALPGSQAAVTGLSNEMSPGAISQLSESDEPAFRVRFTGPGPASGELYWRGPVLHDFDGYTWRRDERPLRRVPLDHLGPAYAYRITLEPHRQRWWFALDTPIGAPRPDVEFTADYQLVGLRDVTQPVTYEARSTLKTRSREPLDAPARRQALRLPPGRNPRAVALGGELRARSPDDARFVGDVLELFRRGGFVYSLTPPKLDLNSVDDFLFNTRTGFCGHYASAFVTLMRAGGVPARVVTGYQGGEWNPIGDYLIVRQSDAHAWAEVWIEERGGWSRVDPTGVVAPDRLTRGFLGGLGDVATRVDGATRELGWITRGALAWDTLNTWWKDQVIEFDLRRQLALLARLGFDDPGIDALRTLLLAGLVGWLGWIGLQLGRSRPMPAADPLAAAYRRLCARLERAGLPARPAHLGALAYAERVAAARPDLAGRVTPLLYRYAALRFGRAPADATAMDAFRKDVAALGHLDRGR